VLLRCRHGMRFISVALPARLLVLHGVRLRLIQVRGDDEEHLLRVVAQRGDVHGAAAREAPGERFPFNEDRLHVVSNETR